jgi:hypothetical protein
MLLIRNLAIQARGSVTYTGAKGARFELTFDLSGGDSPPLAH